MSNSANKWPVNATLLSAVRANNPPVLTLVSNLTASVTLSWTIESTCLPISGFNIYQNYSLIAVVKYPTNTITINGLISGILYVFCVSSFSNTSPTKTYSNLSNCVSNANTLFSTTGNPLQYVIGNEYIIEFIQNGSITFNFDFFINTACCGGAGGGGGGAYFTGGGGGGGGGGGISINNLTSVISNTYNVIVGAGGDGGVAGTPSSPSFDNGLPGIKGSSSSFYTFIALGGQGGQGGKSASNVGGNGGASGTSGSTGGAGENSTMSPMSPAVQGYLGGGGGGGDYYGTKNGANGSTNTPIQTNSILGAGGGGGGAYDLSFSGNAGNIYAGNGGTPGQNGTINKGGGGGGGRAGNAIYETDILSYPGGNGGSGVVLIYLLIT